MEFPRGFYRVCTASRLDIAWKHRREQAFFVSGGGGSATPTWGHRELLLWLIVAAATAEVMVNIVSFFTLYMVHSIQKTHLPDVTTQGPHDYYRQRCCDYSSYQVSIHRRGIYNFRPKKVWHPAHMHIYLVRST